jgi:hypothetical protein
MDHASPAPIVMWALYVMMVFGSALTGIKTGDPHNI